MSVSPSPVCATKQKRRNSIASLGFLVQRSPVKIPLEKKKQKQKSQPLSSTATTSSAPPLSPPPSRFSGPGDGLSRLSSTGNLSSPRSGSPTAYYSGHSPPSSPPSGLAREMGEEGEGGLGGGLASTPTRNNQRSIQRLKFMIVPHLRGEDHIFSHFIVRSMTSCYPLESSEMTDEVLYGVIGL